MTAQPPLFTDNDLTGTLGYEVDPQRAAVAERVVWGWLQPLLGVDSRPYPVPPNLYSWAVELGGLFYENPTSLASKTTGSDSDTWDRQRRTEILTAVAAAGQGAVADRSGPQGSFPPPQAWPDPVGRY